MEELSRILLELYDCGHQASFEEFHGRALEVLKTAVTFDSAIWGSGAVKTGGLEYHSLHLHHEPSEIIAEYAEVKHEDDAAFDIVRKGGGTHRFHAPALFRSAGKSGIRRYSQRFGHQNYIVSTELESRHGLVNWIALYRADARAEYTEAEHSLIALLAPHLRQALKINTTLHAQRAAAAGQGLVVAVVDSNGAPLHAEPRFTRLVQSEFRAWLAGPLPEPLLRALLEHGTFRGRHIVATAAWTRSWLVVKLRPTTAADDLTARERAVAEHLAQGRKHKEIARLLNIAPNTVRTHIRHIHAKLDVHTNAAVAEKLRAC